MCVWPGWVSSWVALLFRLWLLLLLLLLLCLWPLLLLFPLLLSPSQSPFAVNWRKLDIFKIETISFGLFDLVVWFCCGTNLPSNHEIIICYTFKSSCIYILYINIRVDLDKNSSESFRWNLVLWNLWVEKGTTVKFQLDIFNDDWPSIECRVYTHRHRAAGETDIHKSVSEMYFLQYLCHKSIF